MLFFILLLISNAYAIDCIDDNELQLEQFQEYKTKFDAHVAYLMSFNLSHEKATELAMNDPQGIQLKHTMNCLYGENHESIGSNDDGWDFLPVTLGVVVSIISSLIVARYTIKKTEETRQTNMRTKGIHTLSLTLDKVDENLSKKKQFTDPKTKNQIFYVNQLFSTISFDSLIFSGTFSYFSGDLQLDIDRLYFGLKSHNQKLRDLEQLIVKSKTTKLQPATREILINFILELHITETSIQNSVNNIRRKITQNV